MRISLLALILSAVLAGCGNGDFSDLKAWMASTGNDRPAKLEPLPQVNPVPTFQYDATNLQDPFTPRSLTPTSKGGTQPDFGRPKQPLEEFPLDALRMVGTLSRPGKPLFAVIKDPKNTLYTVSVGDHIGQNFGTITKITADGVDIKELLPDGNGGWVSSKANMTLTEENSR